MQIIRDFVEYVGRVLLVAFFWVYADKKLFVRFNTALMEKYVYNEFKCHRDDQRHRDAVVVVCIRGSAFLVISEGKNGVAPYNIRDVVHLRAGDVYALTHDALASLYHTLCDDPDDRSQRVVLTLHNTFTQVATEREMNHFIPPPQPRSRPETVELPVSMRMSRWE